MGGWFSRKIFFSPEFMESRAAMTVELAGQAMCIKDRTIRVNYATGYAVRILLIKGSIRLQKLMILNHSFLKP